MRKKRLIEELNRSNERVRQLEDLICPAQSHEWRELRHIVHYNCDSVFCDVVWESEFICTKCRKIKWEPMP